MFFLFFSLLENNNKHLALVASFKFSLSCPTHTSGNLEMQANFSHQITKPGRPAFPHTKTTKQRLEENRRLQHQRMSELTEAALFIRR
ncbi:hypothetical protein BaRGS_00026087 [Batillaria attramentaria]|uniref:Secreted protein n=1 Tax=Batillaria attramentaria TaxID=370345 RepID=A0ABD0K725_9CAEN